MTRGIIMKFATRLYIGFGIIIFMMTILIIVNINVQSRQTEEIKELVKERYQKVKLLNEVREDTFYVHAELEGDYTSETDNNLKSMNEILFEVNSNIDSLIDMSSTPTEKEELLQLKYRIERFEENTNKINEDMAELASIDEGLRLVRQDRDAILSFITLLIENQETEMDKVISETEQRMKAAVNVGMISIVTGVVLGIALSFWSIYTITYRLGRLKEVMKSVENGLKELPRINVTKPDEIGEIATAYNQMASALESHEKTETLYKESMKEQHMIKTHLAELSILSQDLHDLKSLGKAYLQAIIPSIQAGYGVLYLKEEKGRRLYLSKLASYATSTVKETIEMGEDLTGQCLQDGKAKKLSQLPDDYISISSGIGEASPKNLLILPVELEGEVLAVLEVGSLYEFTQTHESLLEQTTEQLGIIINRIQKQMQVKQLLEATKTLNEELQNQSEELQLQQEELKTMNEELEAQYRQSEERSNDLQEAKAALEEKTRQVLLSSQYKSEFLANMSHELRTPLNSILILAQILLENKEGNLSEKQTNYANTIYSSGKDLLELINDILDLSKIESGKSQLDIGEIDIRAIVSFVKNQFTPVADQKGISFMVEIQEQVPTILYSDEQKIYQVLKNLLSNALKFTQQGSVHLAVSILQQDNNVDKNLLVFTVRDTGIGISQDKQDLIFEAFQQADGTTSRKFGGTGLGLSISKGLADLIGGFITVDSKEGVGSTFSFFVPLNQSETERPIIHLNEVAVSLEEEREKVKPVRPDSSHLIQQEGLSLIKGDILSGKHILLVDDDMRNVFALTTALEEVGLQVSFAENGKEALEILTEKKELDLVLMDIMMPEMDGYEAMRRIRTIEAFKELPIIALTAKAMKDDREKCLKAGASDYISKPVNLEQLLSLLKVWLYK